MTRVPHANDEILRRTVDLTGNLDLNYLDRRLEAPPGFEPGVEVLQTSALPLGYRANTDVLFGT